MSKHRGARRPMARPAVVLTTAAIVFAMAGCLVAVWPTGPSASAASGTGRVEQLRGFDRLVVFGHSMPEGGGASDVAHGYAVLTADATGLELVNHAVGGTTARAAANAMAEQSPAPGARDVVVIHTGMNDIFRQGDAAAAKGREPIHRLLSGTVGAGARVLVLECRPSSWLDTPPHLDLQAAYDAWNAMLVQEARAWPDVQLLDTCARWDPLQFTDPPKYHPNDAGHALIAEQLVALLRQS